MHFADRFLAQPDPFVADYLGKKAFTLRLLEDESASNKAYTLTQVLQDGPAFCSAKVRPGDIEQMHGLERLGFRLVDTNIQLQHLAPAHMSASHVGGIDISWAEDRDEQGVRQCAKLCFSQSRFHLDPLIPLEAANKLKSDWAGNFFRGKRGDAMVVARENIRVVGFLQVLKPSSRSWVIDLVGADNACRRRGMGRALVSFAAQHLAGKTIQVGTQAANLTSIGFYQRLGFSMKGIQHVFHMHVSADEVVS
jgi:GNAT superfamily N-acetyltransferase